MIHRLRKANQRVANSVKVLISKQSSLKILEIEDSQDLNLRVTRSKHLGSGAIIYQIDATGEREAAFAPVVKTLPQNDSGCPHILEHLSCCGSSQYPIRDPFFNMLKRSINSYMNAWTGGDFTAYPFSSPNQKDFWNLYRIYLDMLFQPKLNELDFRQEGWRYEFDTDQNGKQQKNIKGIVYNEMKGAYQNPDRQMYISTNSALFQGTPYAYDSGGNPKSITQLSYQQILDMHKYYYHPSNMSFFFYSDKDFDSHFKYLQQNYLRGYHNQQLKYRESTLKQGITTQLFHECYSSSAESVSLSLTYCLDSLENISEVESHCLSFLSYLLCETNQALAYQHFIETGFADSMGESGFDLSRFGMFRVSLKNVKGLQSSEKMQEYLFHKFEEIITNIANGSIPIDENRLLSYMTQKQLQLLTPKQNNGIHLLQQCIPFLNNRLKLSNLFNIRETLQAAIQIIRNPQQLSNLLKKTFISNHKKVILKQIPSKNNENPHQTIIGLQMPQEIIREQQQKLKTRQLEPNNTDCLPKLVLTDLIELEQKQYTKIFEGFQKSNQKALTTYHVEISLKNIHFIRLSLKLKINGNNQYLLKALELWKHTMNKGIGLSTTRLSNKQLAIKLQQCSRDFQVQLLKIPNDDQAIKITFYASCTKHGLVQYLELLKQMLCSAEFKNKDCSHSFRSFLTEYTEQMSSMPMGVCLNQASAMVGGIGELHNSYFSIVEGMKLAQQQTVPNEFKDIMQSLNESELTIIEHSEHPTSDLLSQLGIQASVQKSDRMTYQKSSVSSSYENTSDLCVTHAYNVNFCTQQYPGPSIFSQEHAELSIFLEILEQDYLHPKIREQGGAYGAKAIIREIGTIALYSYMDPYALQTFQKFEDSIGEILKNELPEQSVQEAKIKVLGLLNRPITPQNSCVDSILKNIPLQQKQQYKGYLKQAQKDKILETAKKYLKSDPNRTKRVVFGCQKPNEFHAVQLQIPKSTDLNHRE